MSCFKYLKRCQVNSLNCCLLFIMGDDENKLMEAAETMEIEKGSFP